MLAHLRPWLEQQRERFLGHLIDWCAVNSGSWNGAGLLRMADRLEADFGKVLRLECRRLPSEPFEWVGEEGELETLRTAPLLYWHLRPEAPRQVLLAIHYDTVYPPGSQPAECRVLEGGLPGTGPPSQSGSRLLGPGVADAKGGIAVILATLAALQRFALAEPAGVAVVLNPDEEIGSPASGPILRALAPQFDFALLFEPTLPDGELAAERKGSGNFTLRVQGRAAHAGRNPEAGRNAIVHLSRIVAQIDALGDPGRGITVNVGRIQGGGPLNRVPDRAVVRWNLRVASEAAAAELTERLQELAARYDAVEGFSCQLHGGFHAPPKGTDDAARRLRQAVERAGAAAQRPIRWRDTGGACDGNQLAAVGLPNVDTMGLTGGLLHSPEEYAEIESFVPAVLTVVNLLARFGSGEEPPLQRPR